MNIEIFSLNEKSNSVAWVELGCVSFSLQVVCLLSRSVLFLCYFLLFEFFLHLFLALVVCKLCRRYCELGIAARYCCSIRAYFLVKNSVVIVNNGWLAGCCCCFMCAVFETFNCVCLCYGMLIYVTTVSFVYILWRAPMYGCLLVDSSSSNQMYMWKIELLGKLIHYLWCGSSTVSRVSIARI